MTRLLNPHVRILYLEDSNKRNNTCPTAVCIKTDRFGSGTILSIVIVREYSRIEFFIARYFLNTQRHCVRSTIRCFLLIFSILSYHVFHDCNSLPFI